VSVDNSYLSLWEREGESLMRAIRPHLNPLPEGEEVKG